MAAAVDGSDDDDGQAIEAGRLLFAQDCQFVAGAATDDRLPPAEQTEVAFAGRSNVGKSSLINALTGRRTLARTSRTPGRTQQINFFDLGGRLMVVDLPGYGYARASKSDIKHWTRLVNRYLKGRPTLRRVLVLVDGRHGLKPTDHDVMTMLDGAAVAYQVVLTKTDKVAAGTLAGLHQAITDTFADHTAAHPDIIDTSAVSGAGIAELRAALTTLVAPPSLG